MQIKLKKKSHSRMNDPGRGGMGGMGGMGGYGAGRQPMGRQGPDPEEAAEKPKIETKLEDKEIWLKLVLAGPEG